MISLSHGWQSDHSISMQHRTYFACVRLATFANSAPPRTGFLYRSLARGALLGSRGAPMHLPFRNEPANRQQMACPLDAYSTPLQKHTVNPKRPHPRPTSTLARAGQSCLCHGLHRRDECEPVSKRKMFSMFCGSAGHPGFRGPAELELLRAQLLLRRRVEVLEFCIPRVTPS